MNHPDLSYQVYHEMYLDRLEAAAEHRRLRLQQKQQQAGRPSRRDRILYGCGQLLISLGNHLQTHTDPRFLSEHRSVPYRKVAGLNR